MGSGQQAWREGIAIVGMSARFPGCASVDVYWEKILAGANLLSAPTDDELRAAGVDPALTEALHFVRSGTRLEDAESFDAKFFELSRREAEVMDPQQRILLETSYEALEHAGLSGDGARVGVFAGVGMNTYMLQLLGNPEMLQAAGGYQLMLGNDKDFGATRVAYKLNLRGPAVVVQTACSTSLAAVHLACGSLLSGECDAALAGGVSVSFPQVAGYPYIPGMILSPDGVCRPFDENAHGTVPGRGAGMVVLKRLSDAERDGDTIYAVIGGSAWNNDGSGKVGYTAPSVEGQAAVIRGAQAAAGITAGCVGYVEAHGTGTELGDPIEVAALAEVFGERAKDADGCVLGSVVLGSVKANMGHADVAAGVAGLIKAALSVYHGIIPPTPHFERANPALMLEQTPFKVSAGPEPWPDAEAQVRWAGVSSFGIGGTNVHLCLRSAVPVAVEKANGPWVFPVSAKNLSGLEAGARRLAGFVADDVGLAAVAATLQSGRRPYGFRRAVVAGNAAELSAGLGKIANAPAVAGEVAFLFPGQGLQFVGMAGELFARDGRFRELIEAGLRCLPEGLAGEIRAAICGVPAGDETHAAMATAVAQPLLFLVEYALAVRWMELGVKPGVLLGHSLGELTAAAVAGVFSFEDGLRLAAERGRLMQETAEGAMLAVSLAAEDAGRELAAEQWNAGLWIAAENAPKLTVISGPAAAIGEFERRMATKRVATVRLATDRAFHTPEMAEAAAKFERAVAAVERKAPRLRWLSNVSGTWITAEEATSSEYWAEQMTGRVRFAENAAVLAKPGYFLLEVGPGDALIALVRQHDRAGIKVARTASSLGGAKRSGDDYRAFLEAAARAWERGVELNWERMPGYPTAGRRRVPLPTYPFERERFWVESKGLAGVAAGPGAAHAPLSKRADLASWFYAPTWERTPAAGVVQPKPAEAIAVWVITGSNTGFAELLAAGLEQGGARVLRLPVWESRAELEEFWREHREVEGNWGLIDCRMGDAAGLLEILQTATRARVRFEQVELVADGLVEVMGETVAAGRGGIVEGMVRMLPAEFARLRARVVDPGLSLGVDAERAADAVRAEIATVATGIPTVAYRAVAGRAAGRDLVRWRETWMPVRMEAARESRFRLGGVYVITGGLGGIGYILARHLLGTYGAKVALLGRTVLPARGQWEEWLTEHGPADAVSVRIQQVKELEALGGELLLLAADVADEAAMGAAWETIEARWGQVHGVIHAAGMPSTDRIMAHSATTFEAVLRPKVRGSEVLAGLLTGKTVDFLLFCSSISSVLTVPAAAAYAAANAFQDRYAIWCRQQLGVPAVSINLDRWRDVGMASEVFAPVEFEDLKQMLVAKSMTPEEGIEVLERMLASGEARMLASTLDIAAVFAEAESRLHPFATAEAAGSGKASAGASKANLPGEFAGTPETLAVMAIWRELLGADWVGPADNFFELGGHSLLGTMVLARIREQFGVDLSIRVIFESPTPEMLGEAIRMAEPRVLKEQPVGTVEDREEFEI